MNKKLMILGASYSQLPLINKAREMGIYTIAASTPGDWPGFDAADESAFVDISDPEAILAQDPQTADPRNCHLLSGHRGSCHWNSV